MVCIKANDEIVKVYQRIITAMRERVEWNGDIIIRKNTMILVGRVRSMYFELATRRVYSDIEELDFDMANAFEMGNNKLITNIINMLLYPFGKWGAIKGLNVEQDYMVLAALFSQIYKEIDVETYFTKTSFKFFINGIQITFEDAMEKCIHYIQKQSYFLPPFTSFLYSKCPKGTVLFGHFLGIIQLALYLPNNNFHLYLF